MKRRYPVMLDLNGKKVTIIGGGNVALRKVTGLMYTGAEITLIAPLIHDDIVSLASEHPAKMLLRRRPFQPTDIDGAFMVFCAIDDTDVTRTIAATCRKKNILYNIASGEDHGSVHIPSTEFGQGYTIAVATEGASPLMAAELRRYLAASIPKEFTEKLTIISQIKQILMHHKDFSHLDSSERGEILKKIAQSEKPAAEAEKIIPSIKK